MMYFEEGGKVSIFLGGYSDFLNHQSNQKQVNQEN